MKPDKVVSLLLALAILMYSQLACQALIPPPTPVASPPPAATDAPPASVSAPVEPTDAEIKAGIQKSLDAYADAYTHNKPDVLDQTIDRENKPFYRIVRSRFDEFQSSYLAGQIEFQYRVTAIQKREYGFVIAHIDAGYGSSADWAFRQLDGVWVLSEPTVKQAGDPVRTETAHFIFTTYPWSDDVNPRIMEMMETARGDAEKVLGKAPEEKANVKIMPIYGLSPFNPMNAIALYIEEQGPIKNIIEVYAPYSYAFGRYDTALGWDKDLQTTLTHEYTHMVHARVFNNAGRLADWMSEGLAEYVSTVNNDNLYSACDALRSGTLIPILDDSDALAKQDLMHMSALDENTRLGYDYSHALVEFTVENYGGLDGFWKLAAALDKTGDFKKAVQDAFGISYDEYNEKWLAWLKRQC
jgi:hypothetical protein